MTPERIAELRGLYNPKHAPFGSGRGFEAMQECLDEIQRLELEMATRVHDLKGDIQRLQDAGGWRDIGEAPKDGTSYLLFTEESGSIHLGQCHEYPGSTKWMDETYEIEYYPTHFMPLPSPPATRGEGK